MPDGALLGLLIGMMVPSAVLIVIWWMGGIVVNPARFCRRSGWRYRETPPPGKKEVSCRIFTSVGHDCEDSVFIDEENLRQWFPRLERNR